MLCSPVWAVKIRNSAVLLRITLLSAVSQRKTFKDCAMAHIEAHSADYTNDKHRKQWATTLETYAYPVIGKRLEADLGMRDILDVLEQRTDETKPNKLWHSKDPSSKSAVTIARNDRSRCSGIPNTITAPAPEHKYMATKGTTLKNILNNSGQAIKALTQ